MFSNKTNSKAKSHRPLYTVSYDAKSRCWYAYMADYPYIPVAGSQSDKRSEAREYAKMYNLLPNKVEEIEARRKEAFRRLYEIDKERREKTNEGNV